MLKNSFSNTDEKGFGHVLLFIIICAAIAIVASTGLKVFKSQRSASMPNCPPANEVLKYSPVAEKDLTTIIPLGNLAPPGHILPTTHMYYNFVHTGSQDARVPVRTTLYVPADMVVTKLMKMDNADLDIPYNAYRIDFKICKQVSGYFILVQELNDKLAAVMTEPYDDVQVSDVGKSVKATNYYKNVNVELKAGEVLGWTGGKSGDPNGLDLGLIDTRSPKPKIANPKRWPGTEQHYVCSLDYFEPELSKRLYAKLGGFDLIAKYPGEPACGTVYYDVPGSAQGNWFTKDSNQEALWDVSSSAALVESNYDHSLQAFSLGNKAGAIGLNSSRVSTFTPKQTGSVNLDFKLVKPGQIYCYEVDDGSGDQNSKSAILIELTKADSLKLGPYGITCGSGPWQFGKSLEYIR